MISSGLSKHISNTVIVDVFEPNTSSVLIQNRHGKVDGGGGHFLNCVPNISGLRTNYLGKCVNMMLLSHET